jgi:hypothetical protein
MTRTRVGWVKPVTFSQAVSEQANASEATAATASEESLSWRGFSIHRVRFVLRFRCLKKVKCLTLIVQGLRRETLRLFGHT